MTANLDKLHAMSQLLLQYETIDAPQIDAIMEGRDPPPRREHLVLRSGAGAAGASCRGGRGGLRGAFRPGRGRGDGGLGLQARPVLDARGPAGFLPAPHAVFRGAALSARAGRSAAHRNRQGPQVPLAGRRHHRRHLGPGRRGVSRGAIA
ncbi:hypothetical protein G6F65_021109 [Rhizopus arrhizus]|nr:hypothetical protein G6F65_021109 [Rhizopus arrhizus]